MGLDQTENDNWQLGKGIPIAEVDKLANELATEFDNKDFLPWYCGAIYALGIQRITEIRGRVQSAKNKGRLFSHYVNQETKALKNKQRLDQQRKRFNDR